jgi:hypothetical protein
VQKQMPFHLRHRLVEFGKEEILTVKVVDVKSKPEEPEGQPRNYDNHHTFHANLTSTACQEIVPQQYIMQQPHTANPAQLETCSSAVHHTAVCTKCSSPTLFPTSTHNSTPCSSTSTHSSTPCSSFSSSLLAAHSTS